MISVVLPSFLGEYSGCAADRPAKLRRAIESFLTQGMGELIIVPDGCEETVKIASEYPVTCLEPLPKSSAFSGLPRNKGIEAATNDYIAYLDSDDVFGEHHLVRIVEHLDADWLWWDDYVNLDRRSVSLVKGFIGTSCIAHKKSLGIVWGDGYAHDWGVVEQLMRFAGKKIETNYRVMHIPGVLDI
jgi:glycosyltransferase involved in cell wall biosynthesis